MAGKKNRSPALVAAGASVTLTKLDEAITKAKESLADKESKRKELLDGLAPETLKMVNALRGKS